MEFKKQERAVSGHHTSILSGEEKCNSSSTTCGTGRLSMLAEPNTSSTDTGTAELLWKLVSFGFSLLSTNHQQDTIEQFSKHLAAAELLRKLPRFEFSLPSPNDQQDKIEQFSKHLAAGVADVKRLEGETEEDLRRKKFAELFNKAPVFKRYELFPVFKGKFFCERKLCEAIPLFRQLDSNKQQETIEKMLNQVIWDIDKDALLERLSEECEEDFRLRGFIKLCSRYYFLLNDFIRDEAKDWDLESLHMQKSGKEEIELITQSRYAQFYLGLASIWFKARWASDPHGLIDLIISGVGEGDHIIEKLENETEEDFRLRRFTESFKQLQFSSQEEFLDLIEFIVFDDLGIHIDYPIKFCRITEKRPRFEFKKVKTPDIRGSGGAVTTQGGGQGAIIQEGQGASQQ